MQSNIWVQWWQQNRRAFICGFLAGIVWGFLTAGSVAPHDQLAYDPGQGIVYQYQDGISPIAVPAEQFFMNYNIALVQITLILLVVSGLAGWATWQLTRLRPRGQEQQPLRPGLDAYLIALAISGLVCVWLFRQFGLASWFEGRTLTPAAAVSVILEILLPLYMGISLFLVWLLRLKSIRAPDWETHYPKPVRKRSGAPRFNWWRRQGGDQQPKE